jgi:hypothetical protein
MQKRSDIFRDMMSYHFSKNRNDDIPMMQQQFAALREAICQYIDRTLPLHDKIEELERKIDGLDKYKYELMKIGNYRGRIIDEFRHKIEKGELKCCPNCHTIVENFSSIRTAKPSTDGSPADYDIVYRCEHCMMKPKEEPKPEVQQPLIFMSSTEKDYTCPDCGEKYRGGHFCGIRKKKKCEKEDLKPGCEHKWMLSVDGNNIDSIELPDAKDLPAGSSFTITNTGTNPITVSEKQSMQVEIGAEIVKNKKPECKEYEHEWDVSVDATIAISVNFQKLKNGRM